MQSAVGWALPSTPFKMVHVFTAARARDRRVPKEKPFPWQCPRCLKHTVVPDKVDVSIDVRYDGRLQAISLSGVTVPVCSSCQERVFTSETDDAIRAAMREQLHLLTPAQTQAAVQKRR